jgi:hypothetical protein
VVTEVEDCIARVLSHHVTRAHVCAEISDNCARGGVLVVQTAALVLIRKVSDTIAKVERGTGYTTMAYYINITEGCHYLPC